MLSTTTVLWLMHKVFHKALKAAGVFLHEDSGIQVFCSKQRALCVISAVHLKNASFHLPTHMNSSTV